MFCGSSACLIARMTPIVGRAVLRQEIFDLALPDAVLAGAGAVHAQRALGQPLQEQLHRLHFIGVVGVDQQA